MSYTRPLIVTSSPTTVNVFTPAPGAIVGYVDDVFGSCRLTPGDPQLRARMNQWISSVNGYYYPYLIYHVSHERNVFPQLGIQSDEAIVAHAMPKVEVCLPVLDRALS